MVQVVVCFLIVARQLRLRQLSAGGMRKSARQRTSRGGGSFTMPSTAALIFSAA